MNDLKKDTVCMPSDDIVAREIEGDIIIVPLVAGIGDADDELYTLNETGKAIWEKLDGQKNLADIAKELSAEFSSNAGEIEADVLGFVSEMTKRGILVSKN
jgi:coenzyme PQQ biosynthesis protein PqqD